MASKYGYITLAELELFASEDYSAIDATELADAKVDAKITAAEELINGYVDTVSAFTGTIPDAVIVATKMIAARLIYKWMREQGMELSKDALLEEAKALIDDDVQNLLSEYKLDSLVTVWWE